MSEAKIVLREYGANVHRLAQNLLTITDKDQKKQYAAALIELMKRINPKNLGNNDNHRAWDHLHIITGFQLTDIECPFPMPNQEVLSEKPKKIDYPKRPEKQFMYGQNVKKAILAIAQMKDKEQQKKESIQCMKFMKQLHQKWHSSQCNDISILTQIKNTSEGVLDFFPDYENNRALLNIKNQNKKKWKKK